MAGSEFSLPPNARANLRVVFLPSALSPTARTGGSVLLALLVEPVCLWLTMFGNNSANQWGTQV